MFARSQQAGVPAWARLTRQRRNYPSRLPYPLRLAHLWYESISPRVMDEQRSGIPACRIPLARDQLASLGRHVGQRAEAVVL
jgi:hypothetical protein